jgi:hypothetical protein
MSQSLRELRVRTGGTRIWLDRPYTYTNTVIRTNTQSVSGGVLGLPGPCFHRVPTSYLSSRSRPTQISPCLRPEGVRVAVSRYMLSSSLCTLPPVAASPAHATFNHHTSSSRPSSSFHSQSSSGSSRATASAPTLAGASAEAVREQLPRANSSRTVRFFARDGAPARAGGGMA